MTEEIAELKSELEKTRNLVRLQRVRYQQLVSLFQVKLQEKEEETRSDLQTKHAQLTSILRSLYILEAKLRKEQRSLKTTLGERDALVKTQELEIVKLRNQLEKFSSGKCICNALTSKTFERPEEKRCEQDNKPDLISSIGIEVLKSDDNSPPSSTTHLEADANTYVIASLDTYDASWSTLHVRGANADANADEIDKQNASNENARNRMLDEELQNEMRKFKMKEENKGENRTHLEESFKTNSPRMILKEVTENPNEKLNGPVLNCVKEILSQDTDSRRQDKRKQTTNEVQGQRCHPVKPPKPAVIPNLVRPHPRRETNVPATFLRESTLNVKPLPKPERQRPPPDEKADAKPLVIRPQISATRPTVFLVNGDKYKEETAIVSDESKIVQTVSALLSDSAESEDEQTNETSPTVSQMVKKFEGLKSKKKLADAKQMSTAVPVVSKTDSMLFQTNFEEFHLVDKEIDSTCEDIAKDNAIRLEAEGEENTVGSIMELTTSATTLSSANAKYETFLEVTGLSQKSILTPSRILSNHRNVMKPKDVKYRSRVKAAAGITDRCVSNGGTITSSTMKYWTEPYL